MGRIKFPINKVLDSGVVDGGSTIKFSIKSKKIIDINVIGQDEFRQMGSCSTSWKRVGYIDYELGKSQIFRNVRGCVLRFLLEYNVRNSYQFGV